MTKTTGVMLQGTSSHVGKSILVTALCRIFFQDGYSTAPFKAQNMALNSTVTPEGGEIGRAQGAQAEAAGILPHVSMNPILVKPKKDLQAQVIVRGEPLADMSAVEYREKYLPVAGKVVRDSLKELHRDYQVLVLEGAGSPAEVNLKSGDVVNMRAAFWAGVPVVLVADIDRGGVFASLVGTLELLEPWERELVKGFIINKFRGDLELLKPGLHFLEERTGKPVLGVVPYIHGHGVAQEDSVSLQDRSIWGPEDAPVQLAVLQLPRIANFTDLDPLTTLPDTRIRLVKPGEKIGQADAVIIPGTKNSLADLQYLRQEGYHREIKELAHRGAYIIGICGGYQLLGEELCDPSGSEDSPGVYEGLGLLPCRTTYYPTKNTHRVEAVMQAGEGWMESLQGTNVEGYEIHMGETAIGEGARPLLEITSRSSSQVQIADGTYAAQGKILGTHLHGLFENPRVLLSFSNALRGEKGLTALSKEDIPLFSKEEKYDRLAEQVRECLDMKEIYHIMELTEDD